MPNVLDIKKLRKIYNGHTVALKDINLIVESGEIVAVIGKSGAGKSTLLRCINRLIEPTDGEILFKGTNITKLKNRELRFMRREIGMIFQSFNLIQRSTVIDNVLNGRLGYMNTFKTMLGIFSNADRERAIKILKRLGLNENIIYKRADELSGGQQQRVGIARSLMQDPSLILADEPIASLDPVTSESIMEYICKICKEDGLTCLINLHQVEFAKKYATRIIGIKNGLKVFDDIPSSLTDKAIDYIYK